MNYQVLAIKWRPKYFKDIIGQEHILISLINSFLLNRIHHAYIFYGIRGVGKTTIARLLSKSLNCIKKISYKPCGYCNNCKQIDNGNFIDLIEIDAASKTKVEDTRDFLNNIYYTPIQGRFKIYIIDEFHMLSNHSFNALLKTLEEPPKHIKFILITTNINKIPETILSRCFKFYFKAIKKKQILNKLKNILKIEKIKFDKESLKTLSYIANGSIRDALTLTEQAIVIGNGIINLNIINNMLGFLNNEYPIYILELIVDNNINKIMDQILKLYLNNIDWDYLLTEILTILHNLLMMHLLKNKIIDDKYINIKYRLYKLFEILSIKNIQLYYKIILNGKKTLMYSPNIKIGVESIFLEILSFNYKKKSLLSLNYIKKNFNINNIIKKKSKNNLFFFLNFLNNNNLCNINFLYKKKNLLSLNYIKKIFNINNIIKKKSKNNLFFFLNFLNNNNLYNINYLYKKKPLLDIINFNINVLLLNNIIKNYLNNKKYNNMYINIKNKKKILQIKKKIKFIILNFNYINKKKIFFFINNIKIIIIKTFIYLIKLYYLKYKNINNNYINLNNNKLLLIINKIKKNKNIKKLKYLFSIKFKNNK